MPAFPQEWMDELHARNDIVSTIGGYLPLTPRGGRHWGLCPFHGEKTPSFSVNADKQLYYCFGCHVGGDVIHFVRNMEKISYIEAVKNLAARANMALPEVIDDANMQKEREKRERLLKVNQEAAHWYHQMLRSDAGLLAQKYLHNRGISGATVASFGLGACGSTGNECTKFLLEKGYKIEDLIEIGLARQKNGRSYDSFRQRLIFPIIAANRQVIGFGGRIIGHGQPKYLNSSESMVFNKRNQLYGINMLKAKTLPFIVLVEGYMDVISLHQAGIHYAVATLGTALTEAQARLIKRYAPRVYLAYDGDSAGQNATMRSLDILHKQGLDVFVMLFPNQEDPDDFIRRRGKDAFEQQQQHALPLHGFKLHYIRSQFDLGSESGRESYAKEASTLIQSFSPIEQERYYQELSKQTRYSVEALRKEGGIAKQQNQDGGRAKQPIPKPDSSQYAGISKEHIQLERLVIANAIGFENRVQEVIPFSECFRIKAHRWLWSILEEKPTVKAVQILEETAEDDRPVLAAAFAIPEEENSQRTMKIALLDLRKIELVEQIDHWQKMADDIETDIDRRMECIRHIQVLQLLNEELDREKLILSSKH